MYSIRSIGLLTIIAIFLNYMSGKLGLESLMPVSFITAGVALYCSFKTKSVDRRINMIFICVNGIYFFVVGSVYGLILIWIHYADQLPYTW